MEHEDLIHTLAKEELSALEKFISMRLNSIPKELWHKTQLIKQMTTEDNVIKVSWTIQLVKEK